ncbi:MAG: PAS domain S-box protein, partial [Deltaproteobacteria bacterium]|nr:PAS domain S-box protein [Deltaproteobacteria bacterium]
MERAAMDDETKSKQELINELIVLRRKVEDITERKRAEEARQKSEEKFRNVFDWASDAIILHTPITEGAPGRFIDVNQIACRMLGYSRDELLTMGPPDIVPTELHPLIGEISRQAATKESFLIEARLLRKDGTTFPVESSAHLITYEGKRVWLSHIRDITERKQVEDVLRISEGRYRMAEAIGHVGNWEYNLQTTKFWGSDEAKRIYGFDPEALDFSTDEVENCIPERERVHQALVDLIEADKPYNLEFEIHPKNSLKPRIISSVAALKRDEHGNPLLVTGLI